MKLKTVVKPVPSLAMENTFQKIQSCKRNVLGVDYSKPRRSAIMRKFVLLCCSLIFPLVASGHALADPPYFFIQMADPQFGMYSADQDFRQETINFEFVIAAANRLHPAFVVVCGDLVNRTGDPSQIAEYQRIAGQLDPSIPLYNVAGNHDVGNTPTVADLTLYRNNIGPDPEYYTFRHGGTVGFVLNSSLVKDPTMAPAEAEQQEHWFTEELLRTQLEGASHLLVFQHHPLFLQRADEPDGYFNMPTDARHRYLNLMQSAGVSHVFAGHYHDNALGQSGNLQMVTSGPVGMPLGAVGSGLRVVIVRDSSIEHRYFEFDSIPDAISVE